MNLIQRLGRTALLAAMIAGLSAQLSAQTTTNKAAPAKKPAVESSEPAKTEKKPSAGPFHGKLAAVDQVAKTITIGKRTFQITPETRIKKNGKPATLADGVVGEQVSGYVKPTESGKLAATVVTFGPKPDSKNTDSKKSSAEKEPK